MYHIFDVFFAKMLMNDTEHLHKAQMAESYLYKETERDAGSRLILNRIIWYLYGMSALRIIPFGQKIKYTQIQTPK